MSVADLLARQGERQMNDQRTTAPARLPRSVTPADLAPVLAAIERASAARMDGQRAPPPAELRERRLHELEVYVERQQQRSLDNQRVGLTEAKEKAMDAEALAGWVVQLHKMRYDVRSAPRC
jgi:hypothetical protein